MRRLTQSRILQQVKRFVKRTVVSACVRRKLVDTDFPPQVWIENTNRCNARCVMCPRDLHTRPQGFMEFSLFEKIVREISPYSSRVKRVHLHNFGEPLLDSQLVQRIRLAKKYGIRHTYFVTNASLLTPDKSREIIATELDEFKISFYGTDRETYNRTMRGLDFDRTVQNVKDFFRIRAESGSKRPAVIIQYLPQQSNRANISGFQALFEDFIDRKTGDNINIFSLHNFGGGRNYRNAGGRPCVICDYPWRTLVILHDGKAVICCLDFNGVQVIGDATRETIFDIWNGPAMRKVKSDFKRLVYDDYPVCQRCDRVR